MELPDLPPTLEVEDVAALFVQEIKITQEAADPAQRMSDVLRTLGIAQRPHEVNLAVPELNLIALTPENIGKDNHAVWHETNHVILHWCGAERWLERYADDPDTLNEWMCHNMAVFWQIRQASVDQATDIHGVTAEAVADIAVQAKADFGAALRRLIHDCPDTPRAGFIVESGHVIQVEVNNMRLPFWKYHKVDIERVARLFPGLNLSLRQVGRNRFIGVITP